ncbi:helix-turn-helix domain-containing protein [Polaromonas sp. P1-6]|nr:helix-turn-helix domain-containing protein [Polaromonas sp. P1-6]UUZ69251.1 helix-turn-helix domain-containing protein [Polaromonas sp. P2-4]
MDTKEIAPVPPENAKLYSFEPASPLSVEEPIAWYLHHAAAAADKAGLKTVRTEARAAFMRQFGQRCKVARGAREINDVAATVGVHRNTIWNIERGDSLPDAFELEVLAKEYNTTPTYLLGVSGMKRPSRSGWCLKACRRCRWMRLFMFRCSTSDFRPVAARSMTSIL